MRFAPTTAVPNPRRRAALVVSALLATGALAASGCGDSSDDTNATTSATVAPAAQSVAKTDVQVARTRLGAVGYRSVGSGSPVVLIMGFGSSMEDWAPPFVDALAETHRVVMLDNAGIGETDALDGTLTIPKMADQTGALITALGLGKPDVVGWSMGGMIAQALAVRHADQVDSVVLAATKPGNGKAESISQETAAALNATPETFLAALFPDDKKAALEAYVDDIARYDTRGTVPDEIYATQRAAINRWNGGEEPAGRELGASNVRALVAQGVDDKLSPLVNSRELAKLMRNEELKLYEDAGHAFLFQEDTKFADAVEAFLEG